jgi:hypothetical protein
MDDANQAARRALTATAALDLVTTRTLIEVLALLGIEWSPIPFDELIRPSEKGLIQPSAEGLYAWVIGRGQDRIDPLDRPVAYIGVGASKDGGLQGRLLAESNIIHDSAAHAHGRAMSRLHGSPLGGPVRQIAGADISPIEETIRASRFAQREAGIQELRSWLSASRPDTVHKAEQLCIRAAIHIGDTPPPVNSQYAGAWGSEAASDWGGWAAAQRLAAAKPF